MLGSFPPRVCGILLFVLFMSLAFRLAPAADLITPSPNPPQIQAASDEGQQAIAGFRVPPGMKVELFAAEPMVANPVAFWVDAHGKVYVAETFRQGRGVEDNRGHMNWLDDDLAAQTVEDRLAYFKKHLGDRVVEYTTQDDRIRLLTDKDGDGKADESTVFADGFNGILEGTGAGVLARGSDVYYTNIPNLWRLRDTDGDGKADERESLHRGYGVRVAFRGHDMHGLRFGPDGKLYYSIGDRGYNVEHEGKTLADPSSGAVFRCNPDGSELEVFATGLRNPQELAFDEYGNLFTGDNNSDSGDRARWVHVLEGGDSGWRMYYQYLNDRGPWNREKLWHPRWDGQAAYINPPVQNFADGPSGLTYYSGVGLDDRYRGSFFLCDFRGGPGNSGVYRLTVKPKGATFELDTHEQFVWSLLCTDVDFGPDGSMYIADWVNGWDGMGKGRIYRAFDSSKQGSDELKTLAELFAKGFADRSTDELLGLLEHADMRVRQEAQFALAERGEQVADKLTGVMQDSDHQLARIHALWALGEIGRRKAEVLKPLLELEGEEDGEVLAQAAKVLGEARYADARSLLVELLTSEHARVRYFATQSLGKLGDGEAVPALLAMLAENNNDDVALRLAGAMGLAGAASPEELAMVADHPSPAARMGILLAMRRQASPRIAHFLNDADPRLVLEAARAIHDLPIDEALPQLAARASLSVAGDGDYQDALLRRVLNANFRLGTPENAEALAQFASRGDVPESMRAEALQMLADWAEPSPRDRVLGLWNPLAKREQQIASNALRSRMGSIFTGPNSVRQVAAQVAAKLGMREVAPALLQVVQDDQQNASARVGALQALWQLNDGRVHEATQLALASQQPELRSAGRQILAETKPREALPLLEQAVDEGTLVERQGALAALGKITEEKADSLLIGELKKLVAGRLPAELQLDLLLAAGQRSSSQVRELVEQFEKSRKQDDPLGLYRESLAGGDAQRGAAIFFNRTEVSCVRCHQVNRVGGNVGPELSKIGAEKSREYLLEAIVAPNRTIAKNFESVAVITEDGQAFSGVLRSETDDELQLVNAEGQITRISKDEIEQRTTAPSPMPQDIFKQLSKADLRDLVEFLSSQR